MSTQPAAVRGRQQSTALTLVLEHQEEMEKLRERMRRLEQAVADEREKIDRASAGVRDTSSELRQQRDELAAAVALDERQQAELDALDAEIAQAERDYAAALEQSVKAADHPRAALQGLEQRLTKTQARLADLQSYFPELAADLVRDEAEHLGKEYVRQAEKLVDTFKRLTVLGALERSLRGHQYNTTMGHGWGEMYIPAFKVKACEEKRHQKYTSMLYSARHLTVGSHPVKEADEELRLTKQAERERLLKLGVSEELL